MPPNHPRESPSNMPLFPGDADIPYPLSTPPPFPNSLRQPTHELYYYHPSLSNIGHCNII